MDENRKKIFAALSEYGQNNQLGIGNVDVFCLGAQDPTWRIMALINCILGYYDKNGMTSISNFAILIPPNSAITDTSALQGLIVEQLIDSKRFTTDTNFNAKVTVSILHDFHTSTLISSLNKNTINSVAIISDAAAFQCDGVKQYKANEDGLTYTIPEDRWVPHIHELAQQLSILAAQQQVFVILDVGKVFPNRPELMDMLNTVDGAVIGGSIMNDPALEITALFPQWKKWLSSGCLGAVLKSIDDLSDSLHNEKILLRAQVMHGEKMYEQALIEIRKLLAMDIADPMIRMKLASIAESSGDQTLARQLLETIVENLISIEDIESALSIATKLDNQNLEERIAIHLERKFPQATKLKYRRAQNLLEKHSYADAAKEIANVPGTKDEIEGFSFLAKELDMVTEPDYISIAQKITTMGKPWADWGYSRLIKSALSQQQFNMAMAIAYQARGSSNRQNLIYLIEILEDVILTRNGKGVFSIGEDIIIDSIVRVVRYLGHNPWDHFLYSRLVSILSVEVSGVLSTPLAVVALFKILAEPISLIVAKEKIIGDPRYLKEHEESMRNAFLWLEQQSPLVLTKIIIPLDIINGDPDQWLAAIHESLAYLGKNISTAEDISELQKWLCLGVAIAPHGTQKSWAIILLSRYAEQLSMAGHNQLARDICQQVFEFAGADEKRCRLAWQTKAVVCRRTDNKIESIIASACMVAVRCEIDYQEEWAELTNLTQLLRDLGLFENARKLHKKTGAMLEEMGSLSSNKNRHDFLGLQINMLELCHKGSDFKAGLPQLLDDVAINAKDVLATTEDRRPVAMMLGQLIQFACQFSIKVSPEIKAIWQQFEQDVSPTNPVLRVFSTRHPKADDLFEFYTKIQSARYSEDIGFDEQNVAIAAARLLAGEEAQESADIAIFAIELLANRAISTPEREGNAKMIPRLNSFAEPALLAEGFSKNGIAVMFAALDDDGCFVSVLVSAGKLSEVIIDSQNLFSESEFSEWAKKFPYEYGADKKPMNLFYTSTENLQFQGLNAEKIILIMSTKLQQIPPNLLRIGEEFSGQTKVMASAPSMSWLAAAQAYKSEFKAMHAWISSDDRFGQTLPMIADRIGETLTDYGIELNSAANIPQNLARSKLVIVAAHGGVAPEGRGFQKIRDEGNLMASAAELANALHNVDVVVLFVCSGGRSDKHPHSHTTTGLVKELLDRGCSAVIASPWPLDARVTWHWLPTFLESWKGGLSLMDANFIANQTVAKNFAPDFEYCLAMNVFGNGFLSFI